MDTEKKSRKEILIEIVEGKESAAVEFSRYTGGTIAHKFRRIIKYGPRYATFYFLKVFTSSLRPKAFWGKRILSPDGGIYLLGLMPDAAEVKLTKFFIKNLDDDSVFYDIGAHIGFYTMLAEEVVGTGEIHAFEPNPATFKVLAKNAAPYKNIHANQLAISEATGEVEFYADLKRLSTGSGIIDSEGYQKITAKTITLDDYVKAHRPPSLIKIDVEGAEELAIKGGRETLGGKDAPTVVIEVWETNNEVHKRAVRALYALGYQSYWITPEGDTKPVKEIDKDPNTSKGMCFDNYVFKK